MKTEEKRVQIDLGQLPEDVGTCHGLIKELADAIGREQALNQHLQHQLEKMLRHRFGRRADHVDPNQLMLFFEELLQNEGEKTEKPEEDPKEEAPKKPKNKDSKRNGRGQIPDHLPRREILHDVAEYLKSCTDCEATKIVIRREITEQLEFVPASLLVLQHVQPLYACPNGCEGQVAMESKPQQPIEKGLAGPGLLAHVITSKYADHLPLNRQEGIFTRHGVKIPRQTQWDWVWATAQLVEPLYELIKNEVLASKILQTDDTPVLMRGQHVKSRMWVYVGDERHPYMVFDHTRSREQVGPLTFLADFRGILQADAYPGYDKIFNSGFVEEAACWAHVRRKFVEAESCDPVRALTMVAWIKRLYQIEKDAKKFRDELPDDLDRMARHEFFVAHRHALRQEKSKSLFENRLNDDGELVQGIDDWLKNQSVLPRSPIGEAIAYTLNNMAALKRFLDNGAIEMDNNTSERALRQIAVGRNNWGLLGSKRGGRAAAIHYTLILSCKRHGIDPFKYLRDVFTRIGGHSISKLDEFLPDRWLALRPSAEAMDFSSVTP